MAHSNRDLFLSVSADKILKISSLYRKVLACVICGRLKSAFQIASRSESISDVQYVAHVVLFLSISDTILVSMSDCWMMIIWPSFHILGYNIWSLGTTLDLEIK